MVNRDCQGRYSIMAYLFGFLQQFFAIHQEMLLLDNISRLRSWLVVGFFAAFICEAVLCY